MAGGGRGGYSFYPLWSELTCCCLLADAPTVSEGRDVGVTVGQRGLLECEADAVPEADFEWYKDDRR